MNNKILSTFHVFNFFFLLTVILLKTLFLVNINIGIGNNILNFFIFYLILVYIPLFFYYQPVVKKKFLELLSIFKNFKRIHESKTYRGFKNQPHEYKNHLNTFRNKSFFRKIWSFFFLILNLVIQSKTNINDIIQSFEKLVTKKKYIFLIIFLGVILRSLLVFKLPVTNDEGSYFYDAYLISQGYQPYKDFLTKSSPHIYLISILISLFGNYVWVGRLLPIIIFIPSSILIYLIARKIFGGKGAFFSLTVFSLYPEIAALTSYAQVQQTQILFCLTFLYLIILEKYTYANLFLMSSILVFSYITRPTSIIFLPIFLVYLYFLFLRKKLTFIKLINIGGFFTINTLLITSVLFFLVNKFIGFRKTVDFFGLEMLSQSTPDVYKLSFVNFIYARVNNVFSFLGFLSNMPFLFFSLFLLPWLSFFKKSKYFLIGLSLTLSFLYFFVLRSIFDVRVASKLALFYLPENLFLFILCFMIILKTVKQSPDLIIQKSRRYQLILISWGVLIIGLYAFWIKFNAPYFIELIPILIFSIGFLYNLFLKDSKAIVKFIFLSTIIVSIFVSQVRGFTRFYSGTYNVEIIGKVNKVILENSTDKDKIMTASLVFPFTAKRQVPFNISHPYWYGYVFIDEELLSLYMPGFKEYEKYIVNNPPKLIINDKTTYETFIKKSPIIQRLIKKKYKNIYKMQTHLTNKLEVYKLVNDASEIK